MRKRALQTEFTGWRKRAAEPVNSGTERDMGFAVYFDAFFVIRKANQDHLWGTSIDKITGLEILFVVFYRDWKCMT